MCLLQNFEKKTGMGEREKEVSGKKTMGGSKKIKKRAWNEAKEGKRKEAKTAGVLTK